MTKQIDAEERLLHIDTILTEAALQKFNEGEVSAPQLKEFYEVLGTWSRVSENLLDTMHKLGIDN